MYQTELVDRRTHENSLAEFKVCNLYFVANNCYLLLANKYYKQICLLSW